MRIKFNTKRVGGRLYLKCPICNSVGIPKRMDPLCPDRAKAYLKCIKCGSVFFYWWISGIKQEDYNYKLYITSYYGNFSHMIFNDKFFNLGKLI